jgi:hypothetical protein
MSHSDPTNPIKADSELTIEKTEARLFVYQGKYIIQPQRTTPWNMEDIDQERGRI